MAKVRLEIDVTIEVDPDDPDREAEYLLDQVEQSDQIGRRWPLSELVSTYATAIEVERVEDLGE